MNRRRVAIDPDVLRRKQDLSMVQDPRKWPKLGILPMKKRNGQMYDPDFCGFLYCWDDVKPIVYIGNIFTLGSMPAGQRPKLSEMKQYSYQSFEDLIDVWTVD